MARQPKGEFVVLGFDYSPLGAKVAEKVRASAEAIRQQLQNTLVSAIKIGQELLSVKESLMKDWLSRRRTMTEILAEIDLQTDEEQVARIRADMEDKALGSRYIDMSKLLAEQQQSKEHRLMPEYIEKFFVEAYRSSGGAITPLKTRRASGQ